MIKGSREKRVADERARERRGRKAEQPSDIPRMGWWDILWRVKYEMSDDRITLLAAGVAFYALLSLFPALAAIISVWALVLDPLDIARQIGELTQFLPPGAASIIREQANEISDNTGAGLSLAAFISIVVAMFVASKGVRGLIMGLNIVYGEEENRSLLRKVLTVVLLTLGLIVMPPLTIAFIALVPLTISTLALEGPIVTLVNLLRWPVLLLVMMFVIAALYRFAPSRAAPRWEWTSVGTVTATLLWLIASVGLSLYVRFAPNFTEIYGSLGAVVVLLLWFWISSLIVLVGGELNGEMERQTRKDTTTGEPKPMGQRGAYVADTLGEKREPSRRWSKTPPPD
ncbi:MULTISPECIES: YihY/virulence factor BrkB family protein [unclassified Halomonas]|nr:MULTISPECIES: YihY/virulence factor BrkB family protein [unclassified Halomonas]QJQ94548.1 YihY/virulence factor BrkB family protein [Halomonas sp. PA5]